MTLHEFIDDFVAELEKNSSPAAYAWQDSVESVLQETDAIRKPARIAYAETALYRRLQALPSNPDSLNERVALNAAIEKVRSARRCR
jgi:hypothetical protein